MSIQFEKEITNEQQDMIRRIFVENVAMIDEKNVLLNKLEVLDQKVMKDIANEVKQPITVSFHTEGDIVKMMDGTEYIVTKQGWRKNEKTKHWK